MILAASEMTMAVPSPREGEGSSIFQPNELGEGYRFAKRYPSPNSRRCNAVAALSHKGRGRNHKRRA
jgi:hypothetical protein